MSPSSSGPDVAKDGSIKRDGNDSAEPPEESRPQLTKVPITKILVRMKLMPSTLLSFAGLSLAIVGIYLAWYGYTTTAPFELEILSVTVDQSHSERFRMRPDQLVASIGGVLAVLGTAIVMR